MYDFYEFMGAYLQAVHNSNETTALLRAIGTAFLSIGFNGPSHLPEGFYV